MLQRVFTVLTVFVLLKSTAEATDDYYLGELGKPVAELVVDKGKYYSKMIPPLIEGLDDIRLYATPITYTLYGIHLLVDNRSHKKCNDQLLPPYRELAIKYFGNDSTIILNWEEQMVDGELHPMVHVTDFNRSTEFLGSKEIDVGSTPRLSELSGQRLIVICNKDRNTAIVKFIDFKAIKRRVAEAYKNNPVLQNLLRGNYAPSENNNSPIQSPFGITLGKALASEIDYRMIPDKRAAADHYIFYDPENVYKIDNPISHDIFSDYYVWKTSLSDTVYQVMGVKLFSDQAQCKIVMNSITTSLHTNLGGKLGFWMTFDDITIDQLLEKVANDQIYIVAKCTPYRNSILNENRVFGGQTEFAGSLTFYLKDYYQFENVEKCIINPVAYGNCY